MSTQYKESSEVPTEVICDRLEELSNAIIKGNPRLENEFTMRVPAEVDRDADIVLIEAARRLRRIIVISKSNNMQIDGIPFDLDDNLKGVQL